MRQVVPDLAVRCPAVECVAFDERGQLGGRGLEAVDHAAVRVDANVGFHAEEPVVALLGGRHLGVMRPRLVLCRGRRIDDRRIHE